MIKLSTNFSTEMISRINVVLKFALENQCSNFYRKKYGENTEFYPIKSYEDFQKIPFLTKDEILSVPLDERIFVPENEIKYFSTSSGTSNSKKLTILPHSDFNFDSFLKYAYLEDKIKALGVRRMMILRPPTGPSLFKFINLPKNGTTVIPGDMKNMELSSKLSKEIKIQGFITNPTILDFFIPHLENIAFDLKSIKYVILGSEHCSKQRLDYFKNVLPNAYFKLVYGSSETGGPRGYQCEKLEGAPEKYHVVDSLLIETVNDGKILDFNESGKLIVTDLKSKAFPLIRYATDDMGTITQENCPCGENIALSLGGRANFDMLKFSGITLHASAIEKSMEAVSDYVHPTRFQVNVWEKNINGKLKPHLQIDLQLKQNFEKNSADPALQELIIKRISEKLHLSGKSNLNSLVEQGVFLPLTINFVTAWPDGKAKHIISHLI